MATLSQFGSLVCWVYCEYSCAAVRETGSSDECYVEVVDDVRRLGDGEEGTGSGIGDVTMECRLRTVAERYRHKLSVVIQNRCSLFQSHI